MLEFNLKSYRDFLLATRNLAAIVPICKVPTARHPFIALRHDIDISPSLSLDMARLEGELGISATYYLLVRSNLYNALSSFNQNIIQEIESLGHEVGLHFDPDNYNTPKCSRVGFKREKQALESILTTRIKSFSLHNPSVNKQQFQGTKLQLIDAHDTSLFSNATYLSDSRMNFRGKNPIEFLRQSIEEHGFAQVSLHPEHFTDKPYSYNHVFARWLSSEFQCLRETMSVNSRFRKEFDRQSLLALLAKHSEVSNNNRG